MSRGRILHFTFCIAGIAFGILCVGVRIGVCLKFSKRFAANVGYRERNLKHLPQVSVLGGSSLLLRT